MGSKDIENDISCNLIFYYRQLGFSSGRATVRSRFGRVPNVFAMDDVRCTGREKRIRDCPFNQNDNCSGREGAGVICSN